MKWLPEGHRAKNELDKELVPEARPPLLLVPMTAICDICAICG